MESQNKILNKLDEHCRTTLLFSNGTQMSYGAGEFSFLIGLIDKKEAVRLFDKYKLVSPEALKVWEGKDDPEKDVHA